MDGFPKTEESFELDNRVLYATSLSSPRLPSLLEGEVLWFEHEFGMWGGNSICFLKLLKEAKERRKKTIISLHTVHFQIPSGMQEKEKRLLEEALPLIDALTLFTNGACRAVVDTFPEYKDKVVVLRHGVHLYPEVNQDKARKKFLEYLLNRTGLSQR